MTMRNTFSDVVGNSRDVTPQSLFVARARAQAYVNDAWQKNAAAVLHAPAQTAAYARVCAQFFGAPPPRLVAVTGTDGKTSVADFVRQLWQLLGHAAVSIGTLGIVSTTPVDIDLPYGHTTPDARDVHRILAAYARAQVSYAVLEASSHGLAQQRLDGLRFDAMIITCLGRDHLDYHGDMHSYAQAKAHLFDLSADHALAIANADDASACQLLPAHLPRVLYGKSGTDIAIAAQIPHPTGQTAQIVHQQQQYSIDLPLIGDFQAYNALAAMAAVAHTTQTPYHDLLPLLPNLQPVRGRMEYVQNTRQGAAVYIDYAHTPDALQKALMALRRHSTQKLWVVFGCGGNRDTGKRPLMGHIAAQHADVVIVTDDNPRQEDPAAIRQHIIAGLLAEDQEMVHNIGNREQAIAHAMLHAQKNDIILLAGKGHETEQVFADGVVMPFDERVIVHRYG